MVEDAVVDGNQLGGIELAGEQHAQQASTCLANHREGKSERLSGLLAKLK